MRPIRNGEYKLKRFLTLMLLVLALLAGCGIDGGEGWALRRIGRALGVDLSGGTLARFEDSHGGFHGDGLTAAEVELDGLEEGLADAPGWRPLPMTAFTTSMTARARTPMTTASSTSGTPGTSPWRCMTAGPGGCAITNLTRRRRFQ